MEKVYVDKNNEAFVVCPKCGFEKNVDAAKFRKIKNMVKGECKCKEAFQFALEYRKHYRKNVRLAGEYIIQKNRKKGEIIIRELSLTGIRFESLKPNQISKNDILEIEFKLDNPQRSEIRKLAKVVWLNDRFVGANFSETDLPNQALGFYLKT
jgi:PilZ domain